MTGGENSAISQKVVNFMDPSPLVTKQWLLVDPLTLGKLLEKMIEEKLYCSLDVMALVFLSS